MKSETLANEAKSPDRVMQDVLLAEEQARQKIRDCEQNAQQQLEAARHTAHRISERANLRIARIHKISRELISQEVEIIEQTVNKQYPTGQLHLDNEKQQQVLQEIAELLTTD